MSKHDFESLEKCLEIPGLMEKMVMMTTMWTLLVMMKIEMAVIWNITLQSKPHKGRLGDAQKDVMDMR